MCWYKLPKYIVIGLLLLPGSLALPGCAPAPKAGNSSPKYFDLKGYFNAEAAKLSKQHTRVKKTAIYNSKAQTKTLLIGSWKRELALFIQSDINKPSWKDSYTISANADSTIYKSTDPNTPTRSIIIHKLGSQIKAIFIVNQTQNLLYQTEEHLSFYPDSLYRIDKTQNITLLGSNHYVIESSWIPPTR